MEVLKANRDAFWQSFEFLKEQVVELFLDVDVGKLKMELSSGGNEDSSSSSENNPRIGEEQIGLS